MNNLKELPSEDEVIAEFGAVYDSLRTLILGNLPEALPEWIGLNDHHKKVFTLAVMPELRNVAEMFAALSAHLEECEY